MKVVNYVSDSSHSKFLVFLTIWRFITAQMDSDEEYKGSSPSSRGSFSDSDDDRKRSRGSAQPSRNIGSDKKGASGGYSWEDQYQRTWDIVKEDDSGVSLESVIQTMIENRKKKIMKNPTAPYQRGIIRTLIVIIDGSLVMLEKDLRPNRFSMMLSLLQEFVIEFFDQNPISQMGIVLMRNGISHLISEVNGSPQFHIDKIRQLRARQHNRFEPKGDPSLQNALELARSLLRYNFGNNINDTKNSKEILIIFGALFTSDPGDIHKTINSLVKDDIKVKVIGLSAQVAICQEIVNRTNHMKNNTNNPNYGVIMNESHFKELLMDCVIPLPITLQKQKEIESSKAVPLIKMGFPTKIQPSLSSSSSGNTLDFIQICACHPHSGAEDANNNGIDVSAATRNSSVIGYQCPQCYSKVCSLPTVCPICGLMLILSTHLARSYHHLVPLVDYEEVPVSESYPSSLCYGCLLKFPEGTKEIDTINLSGDSEKLETRISSRYRCKKCRNDFCIDCDVFVHETVHNCPGCENK